jgi:tRNA pseudouridine38-40 synthase
VTAGRPSAGKAGPASARADVPAEGQRRLKLVVAYDGAGFRGFAPQPGQRTVGGELAGVIGRVTGQPPVRLVCAGRTDAGVHAWGQVVHVDLPLAVDPARLARACNALLAPSIVVRQAEVAAPGFDARRSATSRCYRYLVLNSPLPHPLLARTAWHVPERLDLRAMQAAADPLLGEHDFSCFCRRPPPRPGGDPASLVRRVLEASWTEETPAWQPAGGDAGGRLLRFEVEATAFCHQMVRSMVGTMVAVGRGRLRAGELSDLVRRGDRALLPAPSPPHGLWLWRVRY